MATESIEALAEAERQLGIALKKVAFLQGLLVQASDPEGCAVSPSIRKKLPQLYDQLTFLEACFFDTATGDQLAEYQKILSQ